MGRLDLHTTDMTRDKDEVTPAGKYTCLSTLYLKIKTTTTKKTLVVQYVYLKESSEKKPAMHTVIHMLQFTQRV